MKRFTTYLHYLRFWRYPKKIWIPILLVLLIGGYFLFKPKSNVESIQLTTVKRQNIKETINASGVLAGKETANLRFLSSGKLAEISVHEGDRVVKDDRIAALDMQQISINLTQAQNNYRASQANVDKIIDDIHLNQYGNGGESQIGSAEETQTQRNQRTAAEVSRDNAYDSLKTAQRAFQDAVLFTPIEGVVTLTVPVQGQNVSAADTIAQVVDDSEIFLDAEVDESDIGKVYVGARADITLNSHPDQTFHGSVSQIIPTTKTTTSGATVVVARIKLDEQTINFIANINGQANITVKEAQNVLTVPQDSLVEGKYVYVKDGTKFVKTEVKTGISSETDIEITEGIKEGQEIVTNPAAVPNNEK